MPPGIEFDGHLSYEEFKQALCLFSSWWERHCPQQPAWSISCVVLPVTGQVVQHAVMERLVAAATGSSSSRHHLQQQHHNQQLPADGSHIPQQQQQQQEWPGLAAHALSSTSQPHQPLPHGASGAEEPADACEGDEAALPAVATTAAAAAAGRAVEHGALSLHQYSILYHDSYRVPVLYLRAIRPDGLPLSLQDLLGELPQLQQYQDGEQAAWTFITAVEHPLLRTPCFMLHPCQTAERMALMMAEAAADAAEAAATAEAAAATADSAEAAESGGNSAAAAAEAPRGTPPVPAGQLPGAAEAGGATAAPTPAVTVTAATCTYPRREEHMHEQLLLLYMRAWFSMVVAAPLGLSMLAGG